MRFLHTRGLVLATLALVTTGCAGLLPGKGDRTPVKTYLLETAPDQVRAVPNLSCGIVVLEAPQPASGQVGVQMSYRRDPHRIERFAYARWADSPARMVFPLLVNALRATNAFAAVLPAPAQVAADVRIENDELRLLHVFAGEQSSHVELSLDVRVFDAVNRRVLANRVFTLNEEARPSPIGGVEAADRLLARFLGEYAHFVVQAVDAADQLCEPD